MAQGAAAVGHAVKRAEEAAAGTVDAMMAALPCTPQHAIQQAMSKEAGGAAGDVHVATGACTSCCLHSPNTVIAS